MAELSDFGQPLSYEGKAIESHRSGQKHRDSGETADPEADWGKHQTGGIDARGGKPWTKIKSGLGFGLHRMADTHYEIPVVVPVTPASSSEPLELRTLLRETIEHSPQRAQRCHDFSADRGLDRGETQALVWDDDLIRLLIDTRELWREEKRPPDDDPTEPITRPLNSQRADTIVYTEKGTVHCICPVTGEQRDLALQGFEAERDTLK